MVNKIFFGTLILTLLALLSYVFQAIYDRRPENFSKRGLYSWEDQNNILYIGHEPPEGAKNIKEVKKEKVAKYSSIFGATDNLPLKK